MNKTKLSKMIRKVKADLKIELPKFDDFTCSNHFQNLLISEQVLQEQIEAILSDKNMSLDEKQKIKAL